MVASRRTAVLIALAAAGVALLVVWGPGTASRTQDRAAPDRGTTRSLAPPSEGEPQRVSGAGRADEPTAAGPVLLFGRVLEDGSDDPVSGATVKAYDYEHARTLQACSDVDGAFRIPETRDARGAFHLVVRHDRYARHVQRYVRASRTPMVVRLGAGGSILGRVVGADGRPVRAYRISAVRVLFEREGDWDPHEILYHQILPDELAVAATLVVESEDGSFRITNLASGKYALLVVAPGFAPHFDNGGDHLDRYSGFEVRQSAETPVEIRLPDTAAYRVLVVDEETGDGLSGVRFHQALTVDRRATLVPLPATERSEGLYKLRTALSNGKQLASTRLVVSKEGHASATISFAGQEPGHQFRVVLGRGGSVRGHVWEGGEPVAGAILLFERDVDGAVLAAAISEPDGFFEVTRLVAGTDIVCHCYASGLRRKLAALGLRLEDGEARTLEIGFASSTAIQGRVRLGGEPVRDALIAVYHEGGRAGDDLVESADREGRFRFENLEAGRYEVFFNLDRAFLTRFVDLAKGQCLELDVDASRVVKGVLLDAATGRPVTNRTQVEIRATRQGSEDYAEASPGQDGQFELWIAAPGVYQIDCPDEQDFYLHERPRVDLTQAREVTGVRLRLVPDRQDGKITIYAVDAKTGQPIPEGWSRYWHRTMSGMANWEEGKDQYDRCAVGRYRILIGTDEHVPERLEVEITPQCNEIERTVVLTPADAVRVVRLLRGSNAGRAGVQAGDLIVACAGARIRNLADLRAALEKAQGPFTIEYRREGKTATATLVGKPLGVEIRNVRVGE